MVKVSKNKRIKQKHYLKKYRQNISPQNTQKHGEVLQTLRRVNTKKTTPKHTTAKLLNNKEKENNLQIHQRKRDILPLKEHSNHQMISQQEI